jgi:hypothetical protein
LVLPLPFVFGLDSFGHFFNANTRKDQMQWQMAKEIPKPRTKDQLAQRGRERRPCFAEGFAKASERPMRGQLLPGAQSSQFENLVLTLEVRSLVLEFEISVKFKFVGHIAVRKLNLLCHDRKWSA